MRIHLRSLVIAAAACLTAAGTAAAQEKTTGLLNSLEVRQLVTRGDAADNARLVVHFSALADRYAAEAKKHEAMSGMVVGNPSRSLSTGLSAHCERLAKLNTEEAATARELVAFHEKLAAGATAVPPRGAAQLQGGAGAPEPTNRELDAMAAKAGTPAEHQALEAYFRALSTRYSAEANAHVTLSASYRGTKIAQAAGIHDHLARVARESAKEAAAAAEIHKQLAR